MKEIINHIISLNQDISFVSADHQRWSPQSNTIYYIEGDEIEHVWGLLHEIAHARLKHEDFSTDSDLVQKEVAAWVDAKRYALALKIEINEDYIQNCIDTYRDWAHRRSLCPVCYAQGIQEPTGLYICMNCRNSWRVSKERFCRPYRALENKKAPHHN